MRCLCYQKPSSASPSPFFFFCPPPCASTCRSYISATYRNISTYGDQPVRLSLTCSGPVASSAFLSSRTRRKRGNRSETPRSSISCLDKPSETNEDIQWTTYQTLCGCVHWTETQICSEHLPNDPGFEPDIRLCSAHLDVATCLVRFQRLQSRIVRCQCLLAEAGTDLADGLVFFRIRVIARKEERPVHVRPLAFTVVSTNNDKVQ